MHKISKSLKSEEVAKLLGITTRTLSTWRRKGIGPPYLKIGERFVRYPMERLFAWYKDVWGSDLNRTT